MVDVNVHDQKCTIHNHQNGLSYVDETAVALADFSDLRKYESLSKTVQACSSMVPGQLDSWIKQKSKSTDTVCFIWPTLASLMTPTIWPVKSPELQYKHLNFF